MTDTIVAWLAEHSISEVEGLVPDMAGIARGKIVPANKFSKAPSLRLPASLFAQTVTGGYPTRQVISEADNDMVLKPDPQTIRIVPWTAEPTAQLIHDCFYHDGTPVDVAPRYVLRKVLESFRAMGWEPVVAPEIEFFLVRINEDPDYPLQPPIGRSRRAETARQSYSIDAVNEFDPLFEDMYDYCEAQDIEIDTLIHESGAAQMEVNLVHGDPLELADQVFLFKRTLRETAIRHGIYATFMAKPMANEPGSAMHLHQSLLDIGSGRNIFTDDSGEASPLFLSFIAGLQKYLPPAMLFFAPYVNSYRRIARYESAPINVHWGYDNRTVGLRVPVSDPQDRRIENRVAGADANPYLAVAASLACGLLGIREQLTPSAPVSGDAYDHPYALPRSVDSAIEKLVNCEPLTELLGRRFIDVYSAVKETEYETFFQVISSWEREFLLLNV